MSLSLGKAKTLLHIGKRKSLYKIQYVKRHLQKRTQKFLFYNICACPTNYFIPFIQVIQAPKALGKAGLRGRKNAKAFRNKVLYGFLERAAL